MAATSQASKGLPGEIDRGGPLYWDAAGRDQSPGPVTVDRGPARRRARADPPRVADRCHRLADRDHLGPARVDPRRRRLRCRGLDRDHAGQAAGETVRDRGGGRGALRAAGGRRRGPLAPRGIPASTHRRWRVSDAAGRRLRPPGHRSLRRRLRTGGPGGGTLGGELPQPGTASPRHLARPVPLSPPAAGAVEVGLRLVGRARVSAAGRRGDLAPARRPLSGNPGADGGRRPLPRPRSQPAGGPRRQRSARRRTPARGVARRAAPALYPDGPAAGVRDGHQATRPARRAADRDMGRGSWRRRADHCTRGAHGNSGRSGGPPALHRLGCRGIRPRHCHLSHWRRHRGLPDQRLRTLRDPVVWRCDPRGARRVSLRVTRGGGRRRGLRHGLALAAPRRATRGRDHPPGPDLCRCALREPLLSRHASAPRGGTDAGGERLLTVAPRMTVVAWLFARTLLRPGPSLLLLGAAILASNWVWYGSGLFLGQPAGLALAFAGLLGFAYAAYSIARGRHQLLALSIFIVAAVLLPALGLLTLRFTTGAPLLMHDGAYQTEEAIKLVIAGHDPYGVDYSQTSMRLWHWYVNQPLDSSLFHYVYSPLTFLLGVPFFVVARGLSIPFDFRIVLILAALTAGAGLLRLPWRWDLRYVALAALFLDPFFYFPQGRNDVLFLAPLTLGVLVWARGKPRLAALAFGVAFAFKPFALFFLPCVVIALWPRSGPVLDRARRLALIGAALLAPAAITMGPFLLWNALAYWTDTVSFVAGTIPGAYRIQGYSLASLLLALHVIASPDARFPFGVVQAAVAVPALAIGLRRIWRAPSLAAVLTVGTLALTLSLLVGRFVNDNYLADLLYLAVLAGAARQAARGAIESSRPMAAVA